MMANEDVKVNIKIDGDSSNVDKSLKKTQKELTKTEKVSRAAFNPKLYLGASAAILAVGFAVKKLVDQASKMEDFSVQFEVLTGSASSAKKIMQDLQAFAAGTPFQFEGIAKAGAQLLGFGFAIDEIKPKLMEIGNVAAASGKPIEEISLIFGQVAAAGKLTGERLLQFQERAIPIGPAIAKTMGIAETAVKDAVTKGQVNLEIFQKAFTSMGEEGGFAFGGLEKQSQTFSGVISTVKDNIMLLASELGKNLLPFMKEVGKEVTDIVQFWTAWAKSTSDTSKTIKENAAAIEILNKQIDEQVKLANMLKNNEGFARSTGNSFMKANQVVADMLVKRSELIAANRDLEKQNEEKSNDESIAGKKAQEEAKLEREKQFNASLVELKSAGTKEASENELVLLQEKLALEDQLKLEAAAKELADKGMHQEALALLDDAASKKRLKLLIEQAKEEEKSRQAKIKLEKQLDTTILDNKFKAGELAVAILGAQSKAGFLISKAMAAAHVLVQDGQSRAAATLVALNAGTAAGPAAPGVVAATLAALNTQISVGTGLSLATIAAQTVQGFSKGGMVDDIPAMLSKGEVVVPPQTSFQDLVAAGRSFTEDGDGGTEVRISMSANLIDFIEAEVIERRSIGTGVL